MDLSILIFYFHWLNLELSMLRVILNYYYKFTYQTYVILNAETPKKYVKYYCEFGNCQNPHWVDFFSKN